MIAFGICALFLISTISGLPRIPAPTGRIRSAVIQNKQYVPIRCTVSWEVLGSDNSVNPDVFTIDSMQSKIVNEKLLDMGSWKAVAYMKTVKCGNLVLSAPFEGARIEQLWKFSVESNRIVSEGRFSPAVEDN